MSASSRPSAFHKPKPEVGAFSRATPFSSQVGFSSALRPPPDTPQRRPNKVELTEKKLLLSSTKKEKLAKNGTPSLRGGSKRYKDAEHSVSPMRECGKISPPSPLKTLVGSDEEETSSDESSGEEDSLPPNVIPSLRKTFELGRGNFSTVFSVYCDNDKRKYALKEFKEYILTSSKRDSIIAELKLWDTLKHRRIARFFRAWQDDGKLFVLMKLCEDGTLYQCVKSHIDSNGSVEKEYLLAAFRDCCSALSFMHDHSLVHMDVKPSNICLSNGRALLCDFGLLRHVGESMKCETDHVYIASEVRSHDYVVDSSADIFSLGISFLELAAWIVLPTNGEAWLQLRTQRISLAQYPNLIHHASLYELIERCMEQNPLVRPLAHELLAEPYLDLPRSVRFNSIRVHEEAQESRPASASFLCSPRTSDLRFSEFVTSPMSWSPPTSRGPSRGASPFFPHRRLEFSSPSPFIEGQLDESALSDRFSAQAVVTPRTGASTPMQAASRPASPRLFTSSPQLFSGVMALNLQHRPEAVSKQPTIAFSST